MSIKEQQNDKGFEIVMKKDFIRANGILESRSIFEMIGKISL